MRLLPQSIMSTTDDFDMADKSNDDEPQAIRQSPEIPDGFVFRKPPRAPEGDGPNDAADEPRATGQPPVVSLRKDHREHDELKRDLDLVALVRKLTSVSKPSVPAAKAPEQRNPDIVEDQNFETLVLSKLENLSETMETKFDTLSERLDRMEEKLEHRMISNGTLRRLHSSQVKTIKYIKALVLILNGEIPLGEESQSEDRNDSRERPLTHVNERGPREPRASLERIPRRREPATSREFGEFEDY